MTVLFLHNLDQCRKLVIVWVCLITENLLAQLDLEEMEGKQVELIDVYNRIYVKEGGEKHEQS